MAWHNSCAEKDSCFKRYASCLESPWSLTCYDATRFNHQNLQRSIFLYQMFMYGTLNLWYWRATARSSAPPPPHWMILFHHLCCLLLLQFSPCWFSSFFPLFLSTLKSHACFLWFFSQVRSKVDVIENVGYCSMQCPDPPTQPHTEWPSSTIYAIFHYYNFPLAAFQVSFLFFSLLLSHMPVFSDFFSGQEWSRCYWKCQAKNKVFFVSPFVTGPKKRPYPRKKFCDLEIKFFFKPKFIVQRIFLN